MARTDHADSPSEELRRLAGELPAWARELGFAALRIADAQIGDAAAGLQAWVADGHHGEMDYMARHGELRARPAELHPGTRRILSLRMNYLGDSVDPIGVLGDRARAYVSRYALGRDYHKVLRRRLKALAERIHAVHPHRWRVVTDSAPLLEVEAASRCGLGWRGKHTLLLDRDAGSWFFLGEILTDLPLPPDPPVREHCGSCRACIDACPTGAIVAPYRLDARRCISYLTIELEGAIPEPLRPLLGNRVYGCDDCQLACPWNRFAQRAVLPDFAVRHRLDAASLIELFGWGEEQFRACTAGSAIHRIGHPRWLRNLAVALGNGPSSAAALEALQGRLDDPSALVREHVQWALQRLTRPRDAKENIVTD